MHWKIRKTRRFFGQTEEQHGRAFRYDELVAKGQKTTYAQVLKDVQQRDYQDSHREIAPLKQAKDAVLVDTTQLDLTESLEALLSVIKERI